MADTVLSSTPRSFPRKALNRIAKTDKVVLAIIALFVGIALFDHNQIPASILFTLDSALWISPFLALSVATAAAAKASGADTTIARIFTGQPIRMIIAASLFGALSPFCSCGVIPVIAGLLGAGVPLAPVMAFWVSSPLMDPEMFILSAAALGLPFTIAKTLATIGIGLMAGFATHAVARLGFLQYPLRETAIQGCGGNTCSTAPDSTMWQFWNKPDRIAAFRRTAIDTGLFLGKWLIFAFIIESLMTVYIPASLIVENLGSGQWWTIPAATIASIPAYLNGYAAIPLIARLMEMGMAPGAAMGFLLGGGITSVPAAIAVFVLTRRMVFFWYGVLAMTGAMGAASIYQLTF